MLCGANTRTNFWPCTPSSNTSPALSWKITNLLLHRLRERNNAVGAYLSSSSQNQTKVEETPDTQNVELLDHFFDDIPYTSDNNDTLANYSSTTMLTGDYASSNIESNSPNGEGIGVRDAEFG